jgi:hypothetical protein
MKMIALLVVLIGALACASPALALSISQTLNISCPVGPDWGRFASGDGYQRVRFGGYQNLYFNQFDDNGGLWTLQNVTIDCFAVVEGQFACENDTWEPGEITLNTSVDFTAYISYTGLGAGWSSYLDYGPFSVEASDGMPFGGPDCQEFGVGSGGWGSQAQPWPEDPSPYIGTDELPVGIYCAGELWVSGVSEASVWVTRQCWAYGDVTITYEYGPVVPEPGTFALIVPAILGIAGMAFKKMLRGRN